MTRFPTYPPDILSRADALLSEKYPDGIVDPRFVEIACEAMMAQREVDARIADAAGLAPVKGALAPLHHAGGVLSAKKIAKAIRGTK